MDRILKKFCAKEVQILLDRIRERPEDFNNDHMGIWYRLAKHKTHYTWIERKAINYAMRRRDKVHNRKLLLAKILEATIDPSKNHGEDVFYGSSLASMVNAQMQRYRDEVMMMNPQIQPNIVRFDSNGKVLTTPCK
jgi:hypothetical protein